MSRQREVLPGLKYVRPPVPEKLSVFATTEQDFDSHLADLTKRVQGTADGESPAATPVINAEATVSAAAVVVAQKAANLDSNSNANSNAKSPTAVPPTIEQWLIDTYTGLGRHLAEELVHHSKLTSKIVKETFDAIVLKTAIWNEIKAIQDAVGFKACMKKDLSRYTVLGWWEDLEDEAKWKQFPAVNDMVEEYFRLIEAREQFHQLRERLRSEIKSETDKLQTRLSSADQHLDTTDNPGEFKKRGDLVLAHLNEIGPGQIALVCDDLYDTDKKQIEIQLNPNMSASQNAQNFLSSVCQTPGSAKRSHYGSPGSHEQTGHPAKTDGSTRASKRHRRA